MMDDCWVGGFGIGGLVGRDFEMEMDMDMDLDLDLDLGGCGSASLVDTELTGHLRGLNC